MIIGEHDNAVVAGSKYAKGFLDLQNRSDDAWVLEPSR